MSINNVPVHDLIPEKNTQVKPEFVFIEPGSDLETAYNNLPEMFHDYRDEFITDIVSKISENIRDLRELTSKQFRNVTATHMAIYSTLLTRKPGKAFKLIIHGIIKDTATKPTLEHWKRCNLDKYMVLDRFIRIFKKKGYQPELTVLFSQLNSGNYSEDCDVMFKCDFKDQ